MEQVVDIKELNADCGDGIPLLKAEKLFRLKLSNPFIPVTKVFTPCDIVCPIVSNG